MILIRVFKGRILTTYDGISSKEEATGSLSRSVGKKEARLMRHLAFFGGDTNTKLGLNDKETV